MRGADLALPVIANGQVLYLFGDATPVAADGGGSYSWYQPWDSFDAIGVHADVDLSGCHYLPDVDAKLAAGQSPATVPFGACPTMELSASLPPSFAGLPRVGFVYGASWRYQNANLYLAVMPLTATSTADWHYLTGFGDGGVPRWTQGTSFTASRNAQGRWVADHPIPAEEAAVPIVASPPSTCTGGQTIFNSWCVDSPGFAEHGVIWEPTLRLYLLFNYGVVRSAPNPWGPWSDPLAYFDGRSPWWRKIAHNLGATQQPLDPISTQLRDVSSPFFATGPLATLLTQVAALPKFPLPDDPWALNGNPAGALYAPYPLPGKSTVNPDGTVTVYCTLSTWNPYAAFLMKSTFCASSTDAPCHP